ncbi:MAG: DUF7146 domain-containing protein [Hyphomicrobium sp.]
MQTCSDMQTVKALLQTRIQELVRQVAPDGRLQYGYWVARNPSRDDRKPGSFYIFVDRAGKTPGAWRDEASGDKGDIIDLICMTQRIDRGEALRWAKAWLNYEKLPQAAVASAVAHQKKIEAERDQREAAVLAENQKRAFGLFVASKNDGKKPKDFLKTIAHQYLLSRGIDVSLLARVPGCLGSIPRHRHSETNTFWPVMVAGFQDDRSIKAVHRTFLLPDGSGKADVTPVRKIWPSYRGLAIRLWRGETKMAPDEAAKHGLLDTLALVEGVEDGLSVALARPDLRVWAAGSLGNLEHIQLPACCAEVIVCADNDWGKPQAERSLNRGLEALARQGRKVRVARSPIGKDMNDALRGAA